MSLGLWVIIIGIPPSDIKGLCRRGVGSRNGTGVVLDVGHRGEELGPTRSHSHKLLSTGSLIRHFFGSRVLLRRSSTGTTVREDFRVGCRSSFVVNVLTPSRPTEVGSVVD